MGATPTPPVEMLIGVIFAFFVSMRAHRNTSGDFLTGNYPIYVVFADHIPLSYLKRYL